MSSYTGGLGLRIGILLLIAFLIQTSLAPAARSEDWKGLDNSLREVPSDAAFYVAFLRNREQVEAIGRSKAWKKFWGLAGFQGAWQEQLAKEKDFARGLEEFQKWLQAPENRELIDLFADLISEDVFVYGGANVTDVYHLLSQIYGSALREGFLRGMEESRTGKKRPPGPDDDITRLILDGLSKNLKVTWIPDLVLGCRTKKPDLVRAQMKKLEERLRADLEKYKDEYIKLAWTKVDGDDFLTLSYSSESLKFDEASIRKFEKEKGQYDALVDRVKKLRATISLGIRGSYVILALGESTKSLPKPPKGKRLIDRPELKPLSKFADQRLRSISYVRKSFHSSDRFPKMGFSYWDPRNWIDAGLEALPNSKLPPELQARIKKDLVDLSKELEEPPPGASLGFAFLTDHGMEGYSYVWTPQPLLDSSRPLTILDHVGGTPLFAAADRSKFSPAAWDRLVHWIQVAHGYVEEFGLSKMKPEEKKNYEDLMKVIRPLLARFDAATGKMLLSSLADGQQAFVLDAKLSSKQWISAMPPLSQAIPILEPAFIFGVSDEALLRKAMAEYRSLFNDMMAAAQKVRPNEVPGIQMPPPESRPVKRGNIFYYSLPAAWGLDSRILPNGALSDKIAAITISKEHSERLLTPTPLLGERSNQLATSKRPLAAATYADIAGFLDLFGQWLTAGTKSVPASDKKTQEALKQVETLFEILKVLRSYSSQTYAEDSVWVTHSQWVITDIK